MFFYYQMEVRQSWGKVEAILQYPFDNKLSKEEPICVPQMMM